MSLNKKITTDFFFCVLLLFILFSLPQQLLAGTAESAALFEQGNHLYYSENKTVQSYPYYQAAAKQGHIVAKAQLGKMLFSGIGVPRDIERAAEIISQVRPELERAAENGDPFAQYMYGYYTSEGYTGVLNSSKASARARFWYEKAADQGHPVAKNNLANMYYNGTGGVSKNLNTAFNLYKEAQSGSWAAELNLARRYRDGEGTPKDETKWRSLLKKVARKGVAAAQYSLGMRKVYDINVGQLRAAADQGYLLAQEQLGKYYGDLASRTFHVVPTYSPFDYQAEKWYRKAVKNGSKLGQEKLDALKREMDTRLREDDELFEEDYKHEIEIRAKKLTRNAKKLTRNFHFPDSTCREPDFPIDVPSTSEMKRLAKRVVEFLRCQERSNEKDRRALKDLFIATGAARLDIDSYKGTDYDGTGGLFWEISPLCNCRDAMYDILENYDARDEDRGAKVEHAESYIDYLNSRTPKHDFWQIIKNIRSGN